jgi:hypothetical protein
LHESAGSRDVTSQAAWGSSFDFVLSAPGLVSANGSGTKTLRASYGSLSSSKEVIVVPDGTYRLTGMVSYPFDPAGPILDARVEVLDGPARGTASGTSDKGQYELYGVTGELSLRVTKAGYDPQIVRVTVTDHQVLNIDLLSTTQIPNVSGSYVLTITAADTCGATLPAAAMSRSYSAAIEQVGRTLSARLSGADFATPNGWLAANTIKAIVDPTRVTIDLGSLGCGGYYYGCWPSLLEQFAPTQVFLPSGRATLAISTTALAGELDGTIEIHRGQHSAPFTREVSCRSSRHQVAFTRSAR